MATHYYTVAELTNATTDVSELIKRAQAAGYSGVYTAYRNDADGQLYEVTVDESPAKATLLSDLENNPTPSLSLNQSSVSIASDGNSTAGITVSDSRGASASGKTIKLNFSGILPVDKISETLDGSGSATFTFGPCPSGQCTSQAITVTFLNENEYLSTELSLQFTA